MKISTHLPQINWNASQHENPEFCPVPISRLSSAHLLRTAREMLANSDSILGTFGEEAPGTPIDYWCGVDVGFLPFHLFPDFLGIAKEIHGRNLLDDMRTGQLRRINAWLLEFDRSWRQIDG